MGCVADAVEAPVEWTAKMAELVPLVQQIYDTEWGTVGGPLHVQLDDFNLDDHFCTRASADDGMEFWKQADRDLTYRAVDALAALTEPERHIAVAVAHGVLPPMRIGETFTPPAEWLTRNLVVPAASPGLCPSCGAPLEATLTANGYRKDVRCPGGHFNSTMIGGPFDGGVMG